MSTVRLRRLAADNAKLKDYVRRHPRVRMIQSHGEPPERYQLEYRIKSLRMVGADLQVVDNHIVEIVLPRNYPRTPPQCRMLSPVFHPNIAPHAICVGDHWGAGESLESIVIRIGEMLAYQSYNVKSPLNGEAARWVEQNKQQLPLDSVGLLPEEEPVNGSTTSTAARNTAEPPDITTATPPAAENRLPADTRTTKVAASPQAALSQTAPSKIRVKCPACATAYAVPPSAIGQQVRCTKCLTTFRCDAIDRGKPDNG